VVEDDEDGALAPAPCTVLDRLAEIRSAGLTVAGKVTRAVSVAKLTAAVTPSSLLSFFSIPRRAGGAGHSADGQLYACAQCSHVIPVT